MLLLRAAWCSALAPASSRAAMSGASFPPAATRSCMPAKHDACRFCATKSSILAPLSHSLQMTVSPPFRFDVRRSSVSLCAVSASHVRAAPRQLLVVGKVVCRDGGQRAALLPELLGLLRMRQDFA